MDVSHFINKYDGTMSPFLAFFLDFLYLDPKKISQHIPLQLFLLISPIILAVVLVNSILITGWNNNWESPLNVGLERYGGTKICLNFFTVVTKQKF